MESPSFEDLDVLYKRATEIRKSLAAYEELLKLKQAACLAEAIRQGKKTTELTKIVPLVGNTDEDAKELGELRLNVDALSIQLTAINQEINKFELAVKVYLNDEANSRKRFI